MKVAFVPKYGPAEVVEFRDVPTPTPGPGQVRIRVLATAVTAGDWRLRSGELPPGFGLLRGPVLGFGGPRQAALGTDAAGVIDAVGAGVTRFAPGDAVVAFPGSAMGAHAEHLIMPADGRVAPKPTNLTFEDAVAIPFGAMTAYEFLRRGEVGPGKRVLVNGASGNVGVFAVQIARHFGAHVTAVCSAANAELVRSLGADEVIDYQTADFAAGEPRFDLILDTAGTAPYARVKPILVRGGKLVPVLAGFSTVLTASFVGGAAGHKVIAGPATERPEDLVAVLDLAAKGAIRPVIDTRLTFDAIADGYRRVETGRKRGSVVLSLDARSAER